MIRCKIRRKVRVAKRTVSVNDEQGLPTETFQRRPSHPTPTPTPPLPGREDDEAVVARGVSLSPSLDICSSTIPGVATSAHVESPPLPPPTTARGVEAVGAGAVAVPAVQEDHLHYCAAAKIRRLEEMQRQMAAYYDPLRATSSTPAVGGSGGSSTVPPPLPPRPPPPPPPPAQPDHGPADDDDNYEDA
ncbi:hypothetical protein PIB30_037488 [Stylosanthes scabra]|uniref:Uncharacterized protein n=1 Tax=Stylosanthes scabra TaxID=79078 RepID=A0ABU6WC17_9FABA|nr:hypothetical protein [Stylosanthes scabra]